MTAREKNGEDGNTKTWISQERKDLFRWYKKYLNIIVSEGLSFGEE